MCAFLILLAAGPRVLGVLWWIITPGRWETAFNNALWPIAGLLFLPWTTIMWVSVAPLGTASGYDWLWIGLGVMADLASIGGGGFGNRNRGRG